MIGKRIALCLDGLWGTKKGAPARRGGLYRLYRNLSLETDSGRTQLPYYDRGEVSTPRRLVPGQLSGVRRSVQEAYAFLVRNYRDGDEIYLFGRSRGALAAQLVAAVVSRCGLLRTDDRLSARELVGRFLREPEQCSLQRLAMEARTGNLPSRDKDRRLLIDSRSVPIRFLGVWDTVSSRRIPALEVGGAPAARDVHLLRRSSTVEHSFQALAIDETRPSYRPALWSEHRYVDSRRPPIPLERVEQRWFPGTHDELVGDSPRERYARRPTAWLQAKAIACGLAFDRTLPLERAPEEPLDAASTSRPAGWLGAGWPARSPRRIGEAPIRVPTGTTSILNETVDIDALSRWESDPSYRPASLRRWRERRGLEARPLRRTVYADTALRVPGLQEQTPVP